MKYDINSVIINGEYKGKLITDILVDKKKIFSMIKNGDEFSDEVLMKAGIKKNIRDITSNCSTIFQKEPMKQMINKIEENKPMVILDEDSYLDIYDEENTQKILRKKESFSLRGSLIDDMDSLLNDDIFTSENIDDDIDDDEEYF